VKYLLLITSQSGLPPALLSSLEPDVIAVRAVSNAGCCGATEGLPYSLHHRWPLPFTLEARLKQLVSQMSRDKQLNNWACSALEHRGNAFAHRVLDAWVHGEITRREAIEELITVGASARGAIRIIREIERCGWEV